MPAYTPFLNLYKMGGGSTGLITPDETVDVDRINQNMDAIDSNASSWGNPAQRNHQFYGSAAGLASITGMKRGDTYQESDGNFQTWRYDGSNWVTNTGGLLLIRPSSATGTNVSIDSKSHIIGTNTPSGSVSVDGIFDTTKYKRYLLRLSMVKAAITVNTSLRLRTVSADVSSSVYFTTEMYANGAMSTPSIVRGSAQTDVGTISDGTGTRVDSTIEISFVDNLDVLFKTQTTSRQGGEEVKIGHAVMESSGIPDTVKGLALRPGQTLTSFDLSVYAYV